MIATRRILNLTKSRGNPFGLFTRFNSSLGNGSGSPRKPLSRVTVGKASPGEMKRRQQTGVFKWQAGALFILTAAGLAVFFRREKEKLRIAREAKESKGYGKPLIGGPFKLKDQYGKDFTDKDLLGKFSVMYFGFTLCPDICPDELEKMAVVIDDLKKDKIFIQPIFITCDPARDTCEKIKEYLEEFHPDMIGLTGTYGEIKQMCKEYRVYFSTPPNVKPGQEYIVDHSIFFYLMDPEGNFLDALGKQYNAQETTERIKEHIRTWKPMTEEEREELNARKREQIAK